MNSKSSILAGALALTFTLTAPFAAAQSYPAIGSRAQTVPAKSPLDFSNVKDPQLRARLEVLAAQREDAKPSIVGYRMTHEPWLGPSGDQLVGIVNDRQLTKPQLDRRVQLMLDKSGAIADPKLAEDRRVIFETQVLDEWVQNTTLAVYAKQIGVTVSDREIQDAITQITSQTAPPDNAKPGLDQSRFIGFREEELKQEVRDALMVEKFVRLGIHELVTEKEMRDIYAKRPNMFLIPTRVRAWQLFYPVARIQTPREEKETLKMMNVWRKKLARAQKPEDYQALLKELGGRERLLRPNPAANPQVTGNLQIDGPEESERPVLIDMGWLADGDMMPESVHREAFKLEAGDTSKVFKSENDATQSAVQASVGAGQKAISFRAARMDLGYNVIKVDERVNGEKGSFEQAKPRIETMVFERIKEMAYAAAKKKTTIYRNSAGLEKPPRKLGPAGPGVLLTSATLAATQPPAAAPAPVQAAPAEPDLSGLRRDLNGSQSGNPALNIPPMDEVLRQNAEQRSQLHSPQSPTQPVSGSGQ